MPRKEAKPAPPAAPRRRFVRAVLAVGIGLGLVAGIVALGTVAAAIVGMKDRYRIPLTAVECSVPDWVDRDTFLSEVRYLGDLPETFNVNDPAAVGRVRAAIAKHPWVEYVAEDGYLTIEFRYPLTVGFRRPVLAVTTTAEPTLRTVDAKGILLPPHRPITNLAKLAGEFEPPTSAAGTPWNDATVRRAAELAARFEPVSVEKIAAGWRVVPRSGPPLVVER